MNQVRSLLTQQLGSESGTYNSLSQIGVAFQKSGALALDTNKLSTAISNDANSVVKVLASLNTATDSRVSVVSVPTAVSTGNYSLNVSTAATRGTLVGNASANLTITAGINDAVNFTVNGTAASITLGAGTYTSADALATEVSSKLNAVSALKSAGISVTASASAGVLTLTSARYGITSSVTVTGGNGATDLLGASPTSTTGVNIAGTINGGAATGSEQNLTSAAGLILKINSSSTGSHGTVTIARGIASQIDTTLTNILGTSGSISSRIDGLNKSIASNQKQQESLNSRLTLIQQRYLKQFSALDAALTSLNQTSTYLTQQFTALQKSTSSS
jgi:flagellar hook-associated protein 2